MKRNFPANILIPALAVILLPILTNCGDAQQFVESGKSPTGSYSTDYIGRRIVVRGTGAAGDERGSAAQKKLWALTEARKNCVTQAAVAVGRINAEGTTILEAGRMVRQDFEVAIEQYVRGIKEFDERTEVQEDGSVLAAVTMTIDFDGNDGLSRLLYNTLFSGEKKDLPDPYAAARSTGTVTGVVLDVRHLDVEPSLTPRIYDVTGRLIYGPDHVDRRYAFKTGIVGYTKDLRNVRSRIGSNPLNIPAQDVITRDPSSVLLSREAADRLLQLENEFNILSECRVAFRVK